MQRNAPKEEAVFAVTFLPGSDSTPATPSCDASDFDETVEMSESSDCEHTCTCIYERKFLPRWKLLFPWITQSEEDPDIVYCRDCKTAGFRNDFAFGKWRPAKGRKKEYLQRHDLSKEHFRHASSAIATARSAIGMFKSPKPASASELETLGLLVDVHNGLSMNKGAPLHSLVDFQLILYNNDSDDVLDSARDDVSTCIVSILSQ